MNISKKKSQDRTKKESSEQESAKSQAKFGILGGDLSSKFTSKNARAWRPTKPGGRNGQGKPT